MQQQKQNLDDFKRYTIRKSFVFGAFPMCNIDVDLNGYSIDIQPEVQKFSTCWGEKPYRLQKVVVRRLKFVVDIFIVFHNIIRYY